MSSNNTEKRETPMERADRVARELISSERMEREKKTARLRELRLEMERIAAM